MKWFRLMLLVVASVIIVWLLGVVSCASSVVIARFIGTFFREQAQVFAWSGIALFFTTWILLIRIALRRLWRVRERSDLD